jgi:hypothetical protein
MRNLILRATASAFAAGPVLATAAGAPPPVPGDPVYLFTGQSTS